MKGAHQAPMRVAEQVHHLRIPFHIVPGPGIRLERFVNVLIIDDENLTLVDTGVAGSEEAIFTEIESFGRQREDIERIVLSHSHPDHMGAVRTIRQLTGCQVLAHEGESAWIEDVARQARERPVPGFDRLVAGPVEIDRLLNDGDVVGDGPARMTVLHTPGHSAGSITLHFPEQDMLFTGDLLPVPGDLPIYEDPVALAASVRRLQAVGPLRILLSSWAPPSLDPERSLENGLACVRTVHEATRENIGPDGVTPQLCMAVLDRLGLPAQMNVPMVARTIASHLPYLDKKIIA